MTLMSAVEEFVHSLARGEIRADAAHAMSPRVGLARVAKALLALLTCAGNSAARVTLVDDDASVPPTSLAVPASAVALALTLIDRATSLANAGEDDAFSEAAGSLRRYLSHGTGARFIEAFISLRVRHVGSGSIDASAFKSGLAVGRCDILSILPLHTRLLHSLIWDELERVCSSPICSAATDVEAEARAREWVKKLCASCVGTGAFDAPPNAGLTIEGATAALVAVFEAHATSAARGVLGPFKPSAEGSIAHVLGSLLPSAARVIAQAVMLCPTSSAPAAVLAALEHAGDACRGGAAIPACVGLARHTSAALLKCSTALEGLHLGDCFGNRVEGTLNAVSEAAATRACNSRLDQASRDALASSLSRCVGGGERCTNALMRISTQL